MQALRPKLSLLYISSGKDWEGYEAEKQRFLCFLTVLGSCCYKALAFGALNLVALCLGIFVGVPDKPPPVLALPALTMGHMNSRCNFVGSGMVPLGSS